MAAVNGRRVAAWLISIPLMIAGSQCAHVLSYRLVYPQAHLRLEELVTTGHGYMFGHPGGLSPLLLAIVGGLELVAIATAIIGGVRKGPARGMAPAAFAMAPLIAFTLQEFLERWLSGATFPWWFVLQPTFRVGLLLQIPFAIAVYLLTRLLLRVANTIARALRSRGPRTTAWGVSTQWSLRVGWSPRRAVLAGQHAGRGPPAAGRVASAVLSIS